MAAKKAEAELAARMLKAKEELGVQDGDQQQQQGSNPSEAKKRRREDMGEGEKRDFDLWLQEFKDKR